MVSKINKKNVNIGVDPPSPFGKSLHLDFFLEGFPNPLTDIVNGSLQDLPDLVVSQEDMFSNSYMPDAFLTPSEVEVPYQEDDIERTRC